MKGFCLEIVSYLTGKTPKVAFANENARWTEVSYHLKKSG